MGDGVVLGTQGGLMTYMMAKRAWQMKWRSATRVLCDDRIFIKITGKFYKTGIGQALLYGTEC